jgi:hypothetical protein
MFTDVSEELAALFIKVLHHVTFQRTLMFVVTAMRT